MKFSSKTLGAAMLLAGALGTQSAHAIVFTNFDAVVDTTFSAFSGIGVVGSAPNGNPAFGGGDSTNLAWGTPLGGGAGPGSSLNINNDGSGGPGRYTTNIDAVGAVTGSITHNNIIINVPDTLDTFTVSNSATFTPTAPVPGGTFPAPTIMFEGTFSETPNDPPCAVVDGGPPCSDIFVFDAPTIEGFGESTLFATMIPGIVFGDGMANYWLEVFDSSGSLGTLSDAECSAAGAASGCRGFTTFEGSSTSLEFSTRIVAHRVPEPVSLALLGLGLVGMSVMTRRRNKVD